jgi:hypothetical protein
VSNVIYHDFTPKPKDENLVEIILDSGDVFSFTPESNWELEDSGTIFDINYVVQPCLFGWEAIIFKDWAYKPYSLPEFFSSQVAAEATAEAHRLEELMKVDSAFDLILDDLVDE